jgi:hypothetical protein
VALADAGAALIVSGVSSQKDLLTYGGSFMIGLLLLTIDVGGAMRTLLRARR